MPKRPLEFDCAECHPSLRKVLRVDSVNQHYREYHDGIAVVKCGICLTPFDHRTSLIRHLKSEHEEIDDAVDDNVASTSNVAYPGKNWHQHEGSSDDYYYVDTGEASSDDDVADNDGEDVTQAVLTEELNPYPLADLSSVADEIIMKLRSTARLTAVAIERFQESCEKLINAHSNIVKHKIFSSLRARGMSQSDIVELLDEVYEIEDPFMNLRSIESQLNHYKEKYGLVKPEECFLDTRIDNRLDPTTNEYIPTQVNESFVHISLSETLKLILSQNHNREYMFKDYSSEDDILRSFFDGTDYKNHPLVRKYPNVLVISMFYDDLEIANALGSKTIIHKLGVFFFQILNGPPHLLSKLSSIHLLALAHADDLKKKGAFSKVLYKAVLELKKFGSDNGVEMLIDGEPLKVRAVLGVVAADTLAAHELLGFLGPSAHHFCRLCMISRPSFRLDGNLEAPLRTPPAHDLQVQRVIQTPSASKRYGVKQHCCLNEAPYFHCVNGSCLDLFHDLLEGVVPAVIKMVLRNIIYIRELLTVSEFNMRVASFNYGVPDQRNKPSPNFTKAMFNKHTKIKQTGTQMWCLIRALPFILTGCVEEGDPYLEIIFVLQDIMKIALSFEVSQYDLERLDTLIFTLLRDYKTLFVDAPDPEGEEDEDEEDDAEHGDIDDPALEGGDDNVDDPAPEGEDNNEDDPAPEEELPRRRRKLPLKVHLFNKLHHLKHMVEQMKQKGPVVRLWCAKFEASLKVFRQYAAICCNFKNPPKTMAQMFQLSQIWSQVRCHQEEDNIHYKSGPQWTPNQTHHPELFIEAGITSFEEIQKIIVNGEEYRTGLFMACRKPQEAEEPQYPEFLLISKIYVVDKKSVFFLLKPWKVLQLSNKYNAFKVVSNNTAPQFLRSLSTLLNFRPLAPWNCSEGHIYLSPRTEVL